ncbi:DUF222 domain-containing protein [Spirillospora sp. CA-128828]|uniref:HNH endonuclease signature motif containing protein n=1 Tax=Spirillospora sp. CA-128828 TaxID=3240033 RepID=UPI003D901EB4
MSSEIVDRQREWQDRTWFPPGPQLAICLSGGKERLADLTDDELLQVAAAARRQTSWAQARELAAIAELQQRRTGAEVDGDPDYRVLSAHEAVTEEVSAALSVTGNAAATLVHLAERLVGPLAATGAALEAGRIDLSKARAISAATETLPDEAAEKVEAAALEKASTQTTGQLRRRIKRLAERLAPEAVEERKREAVRQRRLEIWDTPSGTTDLALCDLAAEDAHAIFNKITAAAQGLKHDGDPRPLNLIRTDLATQLLYGADLPAALRALLTPPPDDLPTAHRTVGHGCEGRTDAAESASSSPSIADAAEPGGRSVAGDGVFVSELVDRIERRLAHVRDHVQPERLPIAIRRAAQRIHQELAGARDDACRGRDERHGRPGYRPPAALRLEIEARHATCVFPTCNQPVHRCDIDHTIPWRPGTTCRCNLAPLCRRHHRLKQTPGWKLHQVWPGILLWITPSGAWYIVRSDRR